MILASTALASILFAQQRLTDPATWWDASAYPSTSIAAGESGSTTVVFDVDSAGRARNCEVVRAESEAMGAATCALVRVYGRYEAREGRMRHVRLRDRITVDWNLDGETPSVAFETDYGGAMPVSQPRGWIVAGELPPEEVDRTSPGRVAIAFDIDTEGRATNCRASSPSGSRTIDRQVCAQIEERARFRAPMDAEGRRVDTIGRTTVTWCSTTGERC